MQFLARCEFSCTHVYALAKKSAIGIDVMPGVGRLGKPIRILYVEANEDDTVGGSHQAMFDLARKLDRNDFEPHVLFYQNNVFADRLRRLGISVHSYER